MLKSGIPQPKKGGKKKMHMHMPVPQELMSIGFEPDAALSLIRATMACPVSDKTIGLADLKQAVGDDITRMTLFHVATYLLPISAMIFWHQLASTNRDMINLVDVVRFYAGPDHIKSILSKIGQDEDDPDQFLAKSLLASVKDLEIDLAGNNAYKWALSDLALKVKVGSIKEGENGCHRIDCYHGIVLPLLNCVVPADLEPPQVDDWVVVHFGGMICKNAPDLQGIWDKQRNNRHPKRWAVDLLPQQIDYTKFCGDHNHTEWVESRLGTKQA